MQSWVDEVDICTMITNFDTHWQTKTNLVICQQGLEYTCRGVIPSPKIKDEIELTYIAITPRSIWPGVVVTVWISSVGQMDI